MQCKSLQLCYMRYLGTVRGLEERFVERTTRTTSMHSRMMHSRSVTYVSSESTCRILATLIAGLYSVRYITIHESDAIREESFVPLYDPSTPKYLPTAPCMRWKKGRRMENRKMKWWRIRWTSAFIPSLTFGRV